MFSEVFIRNAALIYGFICITVSLTYIINLRFFTKLVFKCPQDFTSTKLPNNVKEHLLKKFGDELNWEHAHLFEENKLVYKRLIKKY